MNKWTHRTCFLWSTHFIAKTAISANICHFCFVRQICPSFHFFDLILCEIWMNKLLFIVVLFGFRCWWCRYICKWSLDIQMFEYVVLGESVAEHSHLELNELDWRFRKMITSNHFLVRASMWSSKLEHCAVPPHQKHCPWIVETIHKCFLRFHFMNGMHFGVW